MKALEYLRVCRQYSQDYSGYEEVVVDGISNTIKAVEKFLNSKLVRQESDFKSVLPNIWVTLPVEEFNCDDDLLAMVYGDGFQADCISSEDREELLSDAKYEAYRLGNAYSVSGKISIWHSHGGADEVRVFLGDHGFCFRVGENNMVTVCTKHLSTRAATLGDPYIKFLIFVVHMLIEQYEKMSSMGLDSYYESLEVDLRYRSGWLKKSDFDRQVEGCFGGQLTLSYEERARFEDLVEGSGSEGSDAGIPMTRSSYLDAVHIALSAIHCDAKELSPVEAYKRYADGRDEGLLGIEDTEGAFEQWMKRRYRDTSYAEIYPTSSKSSAVFLFVTGSLGAYRLVVRASPTSPNYEIAIKMAVRLMGRYPVDVAESASLLERLNGDSIVVIPSEFSGLVSARYATPPAAKENSVIEGVYFDKTLSELVSGGVAVNLYSFDEAP